MITDKPINLGTFLESAVPPACGGSSIFVGRVRDHNEGKKVLRLYYECYRLMAEKEIRRILDAVAAETEVYELRAIHRVGWLEIGDIAVVISASGVHRKDAFNACRQVIDKIKEDVPIWKKEFYEDSTSEWVFCHQSVKRRQGHERKAECNHGVF